MESCHIVYLPLPMKLLLLALAVSLPLLVHSVHHQKRHTFIASWLFAGVLFILLLVGFSLVFNAACAWGVKLG